MYYKICAILDEINIDNTTGIITTPNGGNGTIDGTGYLVFKKNNMKFQVHQVLAVIRFGKDCIGMTVNHINGIKTDNSVENLELMTLIDNVKHAHKNGLARYSKHEDKMKMVKQFDLSGIEVNEFISIQEASRATGIHAGNISRACRKNVKAYEFYWKFVQQKQDAQFNSKTPAS